jgi:ABC-type branched-subunit amino acid transport system permease subunit
MASGFRFFIKLKGTIDFSYVGLIIFGTYTTVLLHIHLGWGMLLATFVAFLLSLCFTVLILALSARLQDIYFAIGTLAFYLLINQLANNMDTATGGALGLSDIHRVIWTGWTIQSLE